MRSSVKGSALASYPKVLSIILFLRSNTSIMNLALLFTVSMTVNLRIIFLSLFSMSSLIIALNCLLLPPFGYNSHQCFFCNKTSELVRWMLVAALARGVCGDLGLGA